MSARRYGKLPIAYWRDSDWTALSTDAQWLHQYLMSQPTTDTAGSFPIQVNKWAKGSTDMNVDRVVAAAKMLAERGRAVYDHDTEEGLLRHYIRDDEAGLNIFKGALGCALQVQSAQLRAVLLDEICSLERTFSDKEHDLIEKLQASIPAGQARSTTPAPLTATTTQASERSSNQVRTPFERRSDGVANGDQRDGGPTCGLCPEQRPAGPNGMCRPCTIESGHPVSEPTF